MDRKRELKEEYKQMKPEMGIFIIRSKTNNKCLIEGTQDLKSRINRYKFQLGAGAHPNGELQNEWKEYGSENFIIEVLENLPYDKDEMKTDYTEDLSLLQMIWTEKITQEGKGFY